MAKKAAEDWANLLMNEKVHITLEGEAEQTFFDAVCHRNNFWRMMNLYQEYCFALGTTAYVARVANLQVNEEGYTDGVAQDLNIDFVRADGIFPISWENGIVTECAFATTRVIGRSEYVYLQIHLKGEDGTYNIENHLFSNENKQLQEIAMEDVEAFSGVPQIFHTGSEKPFFVIDTPNIANNIEPDVPLGISIYANAIDQLKTCDNIFDSFDSEFVLGRKRIMVKPETVSGLNGEPLFDSNDLVFYILPEDSQTGQSIQEINSSLRVSEHLSGMQMALNIGSPVGC